MNINLEQCPCCGNRTLTKLNQWEICNICNWEDDSIQSKDPNYKGGANKMSLNDAKAAWEKGIAIQ